MELDTLIEVVESALHRHGSDHTLTIGDLLAILKRSRDRLEQEADEPDYPDREF